LLVNKRGDPRYSEKTPIIIKRGYEEASSRGVKGSEKLGVFLKPRERQNFSAKKKANWACEEERFQRQEGVSIA